MPVIATTMQPTFLPWLGYFALIQSVDFFVLLDDVQFCNRSFHSRNKIKTQQGPLLLTVPCRSGRRPICDVELANSATHNKLMRSISQSYAKAPFRDEILRILDTVFSENYRMLVDLNCALIYEITASLGLDTPLIKSTDLKIPKSSKQLRLLEFCEKLNATEYLSVPGSISYLKDNNPFPSSNVNLKFFSFNHPVYPQLHGEFEPYLSVIDAIANIGPEKTNELLRSSVGPKLELNQVPDEHLKMDRKSTDMAIVNVRRADSNDCREVFEWRNDYVTRQMTQSSDLVLWENHLNWYEHSLVNEDQLLLICEAGFKRRKLGIVRFDFVECGTISEISINLSPAMRGKGYAKECLKTSIFYMANEKPMCELIIAKIKKINKVSKILFEKVGFKMVSEDGSFWQYELSSFSGRELKASGDWRSAKYG